MDIGGELRAARRGRKRSIEQIARITKINPTLLRAIENNDFDRVPGGLFTRGYLRAKVSGRIAPNGSTHSTLVFDLSPGARAVIGSIDVVMGDVDR